MQRARETDLIDATEARPGWQEWLGALLVLATVFAGAVAALGAAYLFILRH